jgi:hypothetical protein
MSYLKDALRGASKDEFRKLLNSGAGTEAFAQVLRDRGLRIVPETPTAAMRVAWRRGWFKSFKGRYHAMLEAARPRS